MFPAITTRFTRRQLQAIVFLLVLPAANWLFVVSTLYDMGIGTTSIAARAAIRLWLLFGFAYLALRLVQWFFPWALDPDQFWRQLMTHVVVVMSISLLLGLSATAPTALTDMTNLVMPRVFLGMEIVIYLAVLWMLRQQEIRFATANRLKEAQLRVLKSQSNPHFLFNTLNLISAEISSDPVAAKETVFDLADLLRCSLKLAEQPVVTLDEEMRLVSLYLTLQQRRFKNRLDFTIDIDPKTRRLLVPALLLQPVIENTIKWAVAPYPSKAAIEIRTSISGSDWSITISDSGPPFEVKDINEGDGFRILRETLDLQYGRRYTLSLESTPNGGEFRLRLPLEQVAQGTNV